MIIGTSIGITVENTRNNKNRYKTILRQISHHILCPIPCFTVVLLTDIVFIEIRSAILFLRGRLNQIFSARKESKYKYMGREKDIKLGVS